jgi:diguanylate cyclase (GGDEF)-like protein
VPRRLFALLRLSLGFVGLTVSIVFLAAYLGLVPDRTSAVLAGRKSLAESLAIACSAAVQRDDVDSARATIQEIAAPNRNPDLLSVGLRKGGDDGELLVEVGDHRGQWQTDLAAAPPGSETRVTIMRAPAIAKDNPAASDKPWGQLELRFEPVVPAGAGAFLHDPVLRLAGFVAAVGLFVYLLYLWRLFRKLFAFEASGAIPRRVRSTMNTLSEGVLIVDKSQRIVLANESFGKIAGQSPDELRGRKVDELPWLQPQAPQADSDTPYPWDQALNGVSPSGVLLGLQTGAVRPRKLSINSSPIIGHDGDCRGALATFDNLTLIEKKNAHLRKLMEGLKQSRAEIRRKNQRLKAFATLDPLTGCLNRRAFFEEFEVRWQAALRYGYPLSCVMVDLDHFKSINDHYGHSTGDQVLRHLAETLRDVTAKRGPICRFGGEEFCILLPYLDLDQATELAEKVRQEVAARKCGDITLTASLGVSAASLGATEPAVLLDQADQALYAAKRGGRNRVFRRDELPDDAPLGPREEHDANVPPIPFPAVAALFAALAQRYPDTADHSRRVADWCVAAADGMLSQRETYVLEVAALLHDIGKLGVPDAVLLKPGPLTGEEWAVIRGHEAAAEDVIAAAFTSPELIDIVRHHHRWYQGDPHDPDGPAGEELSFGARLLAIADAYDAMVSNRVYRKGRTREEAFAELHRCAGRQFDPNLVERFIGTVLAREARAPAPVLSAVPRAAVLKIGPQIERLAAALDTGDVRTLAAIAGRLRATARATHLDSLAALATLLEENATVSEPQSERLGQLSRSLLDLYRSAYRSYLPPRGTSCVEQWSDQTAPPPPPPPTVQGVPVAIG